MLWSQFFIPTLREAPTDAVAISHIYLTRAGVIRQVGAGSYAFLPLGYRAFRKIERIIREEMSKAGAIELHMPALQPIELWQQTGRVAAMGDVLLGIADKGADDWRSRSVLAPTHEEVITDIAKAFLTSYKQLPINLYQIQTKFRGEARPKSGLLRTREFSMMDAYSFHLDMDSLGKAYDAMHAAYCRIFERCGLPYLPVEAESGPIGGDSSHEFMVPSEGGEDIIAVSDKLVNGKPNYAANLEKAEYASAGASLAAASAGASLAANKLEDVHTPNCPGIEDVCKFLGITPDRMIKTLVFTRRYGPKNAGYVVACVRGDHEVNENKLKRLFPEATLEMADPKAAATDGFAIGYVGPHAANLETLKQHNAEAVKIALVIDPEVPQTDAVTGNNQIDHHVKGFCLARDVEAEVLAKAQTKAIRCAQAGDLSPRGDDGRLVFKKAIEVGHIFKLGTKYSAAMKATALDKNGKAQPLIMGCYGIGVSRTLAAVIEANHDDKGIIWPKEVAPFDATILNLDPKSEEARTLVLKLHDELEKVGLAVLLDDRDERPGVKFNDADLVGIPLRVTIGAKNLKDGKVEFKLRKGGEMELIPVEQAGVRVLQAFRS